MVHPMHDKKRFSLSKAPDFSAKRDTEDVLKGTKQTWSDVDYMPAAKNAIKRCSECKFYKRTGQPESDCAKVVGIVKGEGVCDVFAQGEFKSTEAKQNMSITIQVQHGV